MVDDEERIADTLAAILRISGYEATAFYNAQSALAQFEACRPELVISDVAMDGQSGIEMAILIRERHPKCKILLLSGQGANAEILEQARGYEFEMLTKPIPPRELLAKVASVTHESGSGLERQPRPARTVLSNLAAEVVGN